MKGQTLLTFLVALSATLPTAAAVWSTHGNYEPDTIEDRSGGWMFAEPQRESDATELQVYFNGWMNEYFTGVNTNSGVTGSAIWGAPVMTPFAVLGVWRDCNADGYIGLGDTVMAEYPTALLPDNGVCDPGSIFIVDGWVYEFWHIGPDDVDPGNEFTSTYKAIINDTDAKVWADIGRPGPGSGASCSVNPQPRGTFSSTGGFLYWADCLMGRQITGTANQADPDCETRVDDRPVCFEDPQDPGNSNSILNQETVNLWGNPYADGGYEDGLIEKDRNNNDVQPYFTAWECNAPIGADIGDRIVLDDPTGGELVVSDPTGLVLEETFDPWPLTVGDEEGFVHSGLYMPSPATKDALDGYSLYEGVNATTTNCGDGAESPSANPENDFAGTGQAKAKRTHDFTFSFSNSFFAGLAGYAYADYGEGLPEGAPTSVPRVPGAPDDLGVGVHRAALYGLAGPGWGGSPNLIVDPQLVNRGDLNPSGAGYFTYYAKIGLSTRVIATTAVNKLGTYGSEWCGEAKSGIVNGVDCDADNWWNPIAVSGTAAMPTQTNGQIDGECSRGLNEPVSNCREMGASAGEPYYLRDTDCYDGQVSRDVPMVHASLVDLSDTGPCVR